MKKRILIEDKDLTYKTLKKHTKNWKMLINTFPYPVSIHDAEFNIVMANKAVIDICGEMSNIHKMKCYQLFHRTDKPIENCPAVRTLEIKKPERSEIYVPPLKKSLVVITSPIHVDGNLTGVIHSVTDVTEIKKSEEDYKELVDIYASSINELKKREQSFLKGRDAFFNMLEDISESYKELEDLFIKLVIAMVNALDAKSH
jgi:PAS domain S-box-containing protein